MIKKFIYSCFLFIFIGITSSQAAINIFAYSRKVPDTNIFDAYGRARRLEEFNGDFVIAVFWSKTCIPCLREIKSLNSFVNKTKNTGIKVVMISPAEDWIDSTEEKSFLKKYQGDDLEFYNDRKAALATQFGIFTSPHAVLITPDSQEIGRIRGSVDWDDDDVIEYIYKLKAEH